jgi:transglutaminase-like putative cysteine protease
MRIRVSHATTYAYARPADGVVQAVRMTPHDHDGQHIIRWRVDVDVDGRVRESVDPFGNTLTMFYADQPVSSLTVHVAGEVSTSDTAGVVRGAREPLQPLLFLRTTPLTTPDAAILDFAAETGGDDALTRLHALMGRLHERLAFDTTATDVVTGAAQAFGQGRGVCQDYTHIFIAAARSMKIPARYVSGHLVRADGLDQEAAHAWAEAFVPDLGWVAFDAANGVSTNEFYLRVAIGLDYLDAAPLRGARRGGGQETMSVTVRAHQAPLQRQD